MIVATALIDGFQQEVSSKVYGFLGHIHITKSGLGQSYEDNPIEVDQDLYHQYSEIEGVAHIQVFANKAGIIKTDEDIEGVILKGISTDFKWSFLREYMIAGDTLSLVEGKLNKGVLISQRVAQRLQLKVDDDIGVYFIQEPPRMRKLSVAGIYNSGIEEFDCCHALVDIALVQGLNDWDDDQISGFEVFVDNVDDAEAVKETIFYDWLPYDLYAETIHDLNSNIFDWLALQNINEAIIYTLMILVAIINIITCLLILILERTNMIGILKSLGATNWMIQKVFVYHGAYILLIGFIIGNVIGIGLALLQDYTHIISLSEESYYVSYAPVAINVLHILLINLGAFVVCTLVLLLPSYLVSRISPVKAIRFS